MDLVAEMSGVLEAQVGGGLVHLLLEALDEADMSSQAQTEGGGMPEGGAA